MKKFTGGVLLVKHFFYACNLTPPFYHLIITDLFSLSSTSSISSSHFLTVQCREILACYSFLRPVVNPGKY